MTDSNNRYVIPAYFIHDPVVPYPCPVGVLMLLQCGQTLRQGKKTYANTGLFNDDNSSRLEISLYCRQNFLQHNGKALRAVVVQAKRNHAGVVVTSSGQQRRVIEVLSDDCSSFCPCQFKNLKIFCIRGQDVANPIDVKAFGLKRSNRTG